MCEAYRRTSGQSALNQIYEAHAPEFAFDFVPAVREVRNIYLLGDWRNQRLLSRAPPTKIYPKIRTFPNKYNAKIANGISSHVNNN